MDHLRYSVTLAAQVGTFAYRTRAWWLVPVLLALGILVLLGASSQAVLPFVYTLF